MAEDAEPSMLPLRARTQVKARLADPEYIDRERPLLGAVLCCTSVPPEQRTQLTSIAAQMGAVHNFDLRSDVTHLIVGDTDTPKYKYVAKERNDVKVVTPEWVEAVRASWVQGGDTDLAVLEEEYRFPTLGGLAVCLTGFEDLESRNRLEHMITGNGAEFRRDLTKKVTHLIARSAEGQKYKFAMLWNIKVVSLKWLEESLERGMMLEETLYDPVLPAEQQGVGAWNRSVPLHVQKRQKAAKVKSHRPRKLRRVTSVKFGDQNSGIWTDIVGGNSANAGENGLLENSADTTPKPSLQAKNEPESLSIEMSEQRDKACHDILVPPGEKPRGIWYQSTFFISGFPQKPTQILKQYLTAQGAEIASSADGLSNDRAFSGNSYMLVPYNLPRSDIPSTADSDDGIALVTDMWVEKCLHSRSFIPPESHITSTPVPRFPIPAFQNLRICSTGFTGIDLLHLSKLVTLLGAQYDEYLTAKASILVCNTSKPNPEKLKHVNQWRIPAVVADWLWISVQTGDKKPYGPYLIPSQSPSILETQTQAPLITSRRNQEPKGQAEAEAPILGECADKTQGEQSSSHVATLPTESNHKLESFTSPKSLPSTASVAPLNPENKENKPAVSSSSLDLAISELLRQKRSRNKQPAALEKDPSTSLPQRRRKLFGRANSNSSVLSAKELSSKRISRASSIDTMNEDGYGSAIDVTMSPSVKSHSKAPSTRSLAPSVMPLDDQPQLTEAQKLLESRLKLFRNGVSYHEPERHELEDEEAPPMTQLGYEAPDAVAMRERFTRRVQEMKAAAEDCEESVPKAKRKKEEVEQSVSEQPQESGRIVGLETGRRTRSKRVSDGVQDI